MALKSKDKGLFGGKSKYGEQEKDPNQPTEADIGAELDTLEKDMNELRSTYELYYMGIEKVEPIITRDNIKATIRRMVASQIRNTALRFRLQQLKARLISLENYWERTARQREAGNYRRDQARVERRETDRVRKELEARRRAAEARGEPIPPGDASTQQRAVPGEGKVITGAALRDGRSAAETSGRPRADNGAGTGDIGRPSARSAEDLTEPKLKRLYQTYVNARKRCGEKIDLRYEDMAAALRKQVPKLIKETGAKSVEFKVVIRSGRAVLKALPKHEE